MIWDEVEVGSKIEALDTFEVQMGMGAPTGSGTFNVDTGDIGEIRHVRPSEYRTIENDQFWPKNVKMQPLIPAPQEYFRRPFKFQVVRSKLLFGR